MNNFEDEIYKFFPIRKTLNMLTKSIIIYMEKSHIHKNNLNTELFIINKHNSANTTTTTTTKQMQNN